MKRACLLFLVVALAVGATSVEAALTGVILGKIVDSNGNPIPGVHVIVSGPNLQGVREDYTTEAGTFRIPELPPGLYTVRAEMMGLQTIEQPNIKVALNKTTKLTLEMRVAELEDTIVVTAAAPVVDVTTSTQTVQIDRDFTDKLPGQDSYQDGLTMSGGTTGGGNPQVHGATHIENLYLLDGVDTTDTVTGTFSTNVNPDAIEQVEVQTGGFSAEYGKATGGIVNAVSKSGGNKFSGTLRLEYEDNTWEENSFYSDTEPEKRIERIPTVSLGGPIIKDMFWFFMSVQYVERKEDMKVIGDPTDDPSSPSSWTKTVSQDDIGIYSYGKLTFQPIQPLKIQVTYNNEDRDIRGRNAARSRTPAATSDWFQGGPIYGLDTTYLISSNSFINFTAYANDSVLNPSEPNGSGPAFRDDETGVHWGNAEEINKEDRFRRNAALSYSTFIEEWMGGSHDLKFGFNWEHLLWSQLRGVPGAGYYTFNMDRDDTGLPKNEYADGFYDRFQVPDKSQAVDVSGNYYAAYAQDDIELPNNMTLNIGVRFEYMKFENDTGRVLVENDKFEQHIEGDAGTFLNIGPRLGWVWDLSGEGRRKATAFYGRYYSPLTLQIPEMVAEHLPATARWFRKLRDDADHEYYGDERRFDGSWNGYEGDWFRYDETWAANTNTIDPDLKTEHTDEVQLGYEQEVYANVSVGATFTYRRTRNLVEDAGVWYAEDSAGNIVDKRYAWDVPEDYADSDLTWFLDHYLITNPPDARRNYYGIELTAKAATKNFNLLMSYTYAQVKGTVFGTQPTEGGVPGSATGGMTRFSVYYDTPELSRNLYGKLPHDIDHYFKLNASYDFFTGKIYAFSIGASYFARNGYAYSLYTKDPTYGGYYSLEKFGRGSERMPMVSFLDLSIQKHFPFAGGKYGTLSVIFDIDNVLSTEHLLTRGNNYDENQMWKATRNGAHAGPRSYHLSLKYAI
jgi:hypothetical protein